MRARLLKVIVQPVFVVEHDDGLEEVPAQPIHVQGRDWRGYTAEGGGFDRAVADTVTQLSTPPD